MTKIVLATGVFTFVGLPVFAGVLPAPMGAPGPLLGLAGPWGLVAGAAGYGAYRLVKASRKD